MKRIILSLLLVAGVVFSGVYGFKQHQKSKCADWIFEAEQLMPQGYYASAIEVLTLYFSSSHCRSKTDVEAVALLSQARPYVPLPDNAHLAQEIMLNKLGWSLKRDPRYYLPQAEAYLSSGRWLEAQQSALKAEGQQAALILLAASIKLNDLDTILLALERLEDVGASSFVWAIVGASLQSRFAEEQEISSRLPFVSMRWAAFAAWVLEPPQQRGLIIAKTYGSDILLSGEDLTIATSLLLSANRLFDALHMLERALPNLSDAQNTLLAKLYWRAGLFHKLVHIFTPEYETQTPLLDVRLLKCLGRYALEGRCQLEIETQDIEKRYGRYAAGVWADLADQLSQKDFKYADMLNAVDRATALLPDLGPIFQFQGILYKKIGEDALSELTRNKGKLLSGEGPVWFGFPGDIPQKPEVDICGRFHEDLIVSSLPAIKACTESAENMSAAHVDAIEKASPERATYWRLVKARHLLMSGESQQVAKAIQLLRPTLKWAPDNARTFQLLSIAYAYFGDVEASYAHLATAVKLEPELAVEATRLALGFYNSQRGLSAKQLVHWWGAFTHIEMSQYPESTEMELHNLLQDRLMLLAQIAENSRDHQLAYAVYIKLLEIEGSNHIALNNLAYKLYEMNGDLSRALELAEKAVRLAPAVAEYKATLLDIQKAKEESGY